MEIFETDLGKTIVRFTKDTDVVFIPSVFRDEWRLRKVSMACFKLEFKKPIEYFAIVSDGTSSEIYRCDGSKLISNASYNCTEIRNLEVFEVFISAGYDMISPDIPKPIKLKNKTDVSLFIAGIKE